MTEQETMERQQMAYEKRDIIMPGDVLTLVCTEADSCYAFFDLPGEKLSILQPKESISKGDRVKFTCVSQNVLKNGFGLYVDYGFEVARTGFFVRINGPDAQSLVRKVRPVKINNRDIPALHEVMAVMQNICRTEELRDWQRGRMVKITASLSGMPGGGSRKGMDDAVSMLDELGQEQIRACREYGRHLRRAQRILNAIESQNMRAFVMMRYIIGVSDTEIRRELGMTRRGFDRAVHAVQDAPDMASVKWQERYILENNYS